MTWEHWNRYIADSRGSSLLAMAITMLAVGFLTTGGIYLYQNYDVITADQTTVDYSREVQDALNNFVAMEGRLPCPAPLNAAPDTPEFGKESAGPCEGGAVASGTYRLNGRSGIPVRVGAVPVRTLNIPDKMIGDGYGRRYVYAVTEKLASPGGDIKSDEGAIYINNQDGHSISDQSGLIIYALMSPGTDNRGAFDLQGNLLEPCEAGTVAGNNCAFINNPGSSATFVASSEKAYNVGSSTFTHTFAFMATPAAYKWNADPWNDCDGVCFSGDQDRVVNCRDYRNGVVDDSKCNHTPKPLDYRVCGLPPCYWDAGAWANCTAGTGIGNQNNNQTQWLANDGR
jgi:hypothetical protein